MGCLQARLLESSSAKCSAAACSALRAAAKQSAPLAEAVCQTALPRLQALLETSDATQQEAAAWTIGYIASHNEKLATRVSPVRCQGAPQA